MPYADNVLKKQKEKEYRIQNKEKIKKYFQLRYIKESGKLKTYNLKNYYNNRDKRIEQMRVYYINKHPTNILLKDDLKYEYNETECSKEFEKIKNRIGNLLTPIGLNKIVLTFQPHFFEHEKNIWKENPNNLRQWLVDNRKKYINKDEYHLNDKELLRSFKISGKYIGFTHFNPLWIKWFIENYNIKSIYDPCCGWGHRLLGANNIKYIGNDLDIRTYEGNKNICTKFNLTDKSFYNSDCTKFTPTDDYEAVFTCPPYNNVEIYSNGPYKNIDEYKDFFDKMVKKSLKSTVKYFVYVINNVYLSLTKEICYNNGLLHVEDKKLGIKYNHFQLSEGVNNTKGEYMVVYKTKLTTS